MIGAVAIWGGLLLLAPLALAGTYRNWLVYHHGQIVWQLDSGTLEEPCFSLQALARSKTNKTNPEAGVSGVGLAEAHQGRTFSLPTNG